VNLTRELQSYQAALRGLDQSATMDAARAIAEAHPRAHALAGRVHDGFVGDRGIANVPANQAVPYERLTVGVAVLDVDPALALLRRAQEEAARAGRP
jgi:hypothetical protein